MLHPLTHGRVPRFVGAALLLVATAACRQDMHDQPSYTALQQSDFFPDGKASRPLVENTVARGSMDNDALVPSPDTLATEFPIAVTDAVMKRGQERFNIYCSPCHGRTGAGDGMVVQRGYPRPPSYWDPVRDLKSKPVGYIYEVITNGLNRMPAYETQVPVRDRWAIAAYVRALQLAATATPDDVPAAERASLDKPASSHEGPHSAHAAEGK